MKFLEISHKIFPFYSIQNFAVNVICEINFAKFRERKIILRAPYLERLVQPAEEVGVLGHAQVGEEVLAGEEGPHGVLVEEGELHLHPAQDGVAQAGQALQLTLGHVPKYNSRYICKKQYIRFIEIHIL